MPKPSGTKQRRWVELSTEQVLLETPLHLLDWPRRAELVPGYAERVAKVQQSGRWAGQPIRVRPQGTHYVLISGFSRLAVAVDAGLEKVRAVVEPVVRDIPLAEIHLRTWQQKAQLNPDKLAQRQEQARRNGGLPVPLRVRPAWPGEPDGYTLLDGLYWYHIAQALDLEQVPAFVQSP